MRESESRYLGQILLMFGHGFKHIQPEACLIVTKVLFIDWNRSFLNFFLFFLTAVFFLSDSFGLNASQRVDLTLTVGDVASTLVVDEGGQVWRGRYTRFVGTSGQEQEVVRSVY